MLDMSIGELRYTWRVFALLSAQVPSLLPITPRVIDIESLYEVLVISQLYSLYRTSTVFLCHLNADILFASRASIHDAKPPEHTCYCTSDCSLVRPPEQRLDALSSSGIEMMIESSLVVFYARSAKIEDFDV
ncbi:hypothetical protein Tco_0922783 [Tanacetum coccineum]|uniref:Uncharacterized protein n=1 Tax=Tanacetum coccineum TaxID=301880 RepID=A0ABQ5D6A9_9ASTR